MILAQAMNETVSVNIAAWLACLAFIVVLVNGAFKLKRNATGEPAVPANPILGQNVHDITRRVKHLEDWRDGLMDKLEEDKQVILTAGEHRAAAIHDRLTRTDHELNEQFTFVRESLSAINRELEINRRKS